MMEAKEMAKSYTMEKRLKRIFDESLEKWKIESQILMMAEESSELSVSALHLLRNKKDKIKALFKFAEELVDVQFMIDEMIYYFKDAKLERQSFLEVMRSFQNDKMEKVESYLRE